MGRVNSPTSFCQLVETELGWDNPQWFKGKRAYMVEAAKVKRMIAARPDLYTWGNLKLAVQLLKREQQTRTPVGVFAHVVRALEAAAAPEVSIEVDVQRAIAVEQLRGDPDGWIGRFMRAAPAFQAQLLMEWRQPHTGKA